MKYSSEEFNLPKKLSILSILNDICDISTRNDLTHYVLKLDVMNYFESRHLIAVLIDDGCIDAFLHEGKEYLKLNDKGLSYFNSLCGQIPASWKQPLDNAAHLALETINKSESSVIKSSSEIEKIGERDFLIHLNSRDESDVILDIKIRVFSEKQANEIASNWKNDPIKSYENILQSLTE